MLKLKVGLVSVILDSIGLVSVILGSIGFNSVILASIGLDSTILVSATLGSSLRDNLAKAAVSANSGTSSVSLIAETK